MFFTVPVIANILISLTSGSSEFGTEFCQLETFDPKCSSNEVMQIEKAFFGRMREGKCITEDEVKSFVSLIHDKKYFHCSVDVSEMLHAKCSFRQECKIPVSDESLKKMNPCGPGLFLNLEVKYKCLPVYQADRSDCRLQVFQEPKYFLFESFRSKICGKHNNPWILEVSKGQKISLAIVGDDSQTAADEHNYCESLGLILQDGFGGANSSLCKRGFQNERLKNSKNLYSSSQNIIRIYVTDDNVAEKKLALKLQAEGCLDIIPPEDTWLKRTNDDIVLGCYNSKQTWYLRCEHRQWVGAIGNCSQQKESQQISAKSNDEEVEMKTMPKHQQILAIVSITGVGVVICSLIVCFGALFAKRYSLSDKGKPLKFANQSLSYDNGPYHQHTYNTGVQPTNNSGYEYEKEKNGYPNNVENNQTYFVLEDEIDNK